MFGTSLIRATGALVVAAVALVVACGGGDNRPEARDDAAEIRSVVQTTAAAIREHDWQTWYGLFDEQFRSQCTPDQFVAAWEGQIPSGEGGEVEIVQISVDGEAASADLVFHDGDTTLGTWGFIREGGKWRLDAPPDAVGCGFSND